MIREVQMTVMECRCELSDCPSKGKPWHSLCKRPTGPDTCPTCKSREWNGVKKKRRPKRDPKIEMPKPKRIKQREDEDYGF